MLGILVFLFMVVVAVVLSVVGYIAERTISAVSNKFK